MLGAWSSCLSQDSSNRARPDPADPEKKHLQYLDKMSQLRVHLGIPKRTCSPNLQNGGRTNIHAIYYMSADSDHILFDQSGTGVELPSTRNQPYSARSPEN
jgi:hypothetical protein